MQELGPVELWLSICRPGGLGFCLRRLHRDRRKTTQDQGYRTGRN
jgi:hypothetical protein